MELMQSNRAPIGRKTTAHLKLSYEPFHYKTAGNIQQNITIQPQPIEGVSIGTAAFLGETQTGSITASLLKKGEV